MKGSIWLFALASMIALLAGCGAPAAQPGSAPQASQATVAPTPTFPTPPPTAPASASAALAPTATPLSALTAQDVQRITPAEARALLDSGEAVLYDARSPEAYTALHAAGALSFPGADAAARFAELPAGKALVFY